MSNSRSALDMPSISRIALLPVLVVSALSGSAQAAQPATQTQPPSAAVTTQTNPPQISPNPLKINGGVSGIVTPGSIVTIPVTGDRSHSVYGYAVNDPQKRFTGHDDNPTGNGLKIKLPDQIDPGAYYFTLVDNKEIVIPGSIDVEPDKIRLVAVHPSTAFKGDASKFNFDIVGENFSRNPDNDDVTIEGQGSIVKHRATNQAACAAVADCLWVENERLMHIVGYSAEEYQGLVNIGIRVGNVTASDQKPLVLARRSGTVVFILAAGLSGLLFWIVKYIVGSGLANNMVGSRRLNLLQSFILDPQTNSYSLSKFQLLAFSATFIFGYLYVLLSRWLVQWQFTVPDVPSTIAGLLGISGGTTVASAGLTAARGSKGAGLQQPTGADLISTGGVVVAERFQFFVWTIVACGGFIALLVGQDPAKVSNFPDLPSGLLYIMGVSAAGYLGGKSARNPGPVLENAAAWKRVAETPWDTLIVQGQNLASNGRFFIDEKELGFPPDTDKAAATSLPDKLVKPTPQLGASDTNFCTRLDIIIADSSIDITHGDHTFRIVNPDGQFADITFGERPSITAVYGKDNPPSAADPNAKTLQATDQAVTVAIKGSGLVMSSHIDWKPPGAARFDSQSLAPGSPNDGTELWVSLVPGLRVDTTGIINVITPKGFVANASVKVVRGSDGPAPVSSPPQTQPPRPNQSAAPQPDLSGPLAAAGAPAPGPEGDVDPGAAAPAEGPHL